MDESNMDGSWLIKLGCNMQRFVLKSYVNFIENQKFLRLIFKTTLSLDDPNFGFANLNWYLMLPSFIINPHQTMLSFISSES